MTLRLSDRMRSVCRVAVVPGILFALTLSAFGGGASQGGDIVSGLQSQKNVAVTIYNSNLGLVRDTREISLPKGISSIKFMDVAAQIDPTSVLIKSLDHPGGIRVVEQNYEYDLLNPQKLLDKYVGKQMTLVFKRETNGSDQFVEHPATLLSNNGGQQVWRIGNEIVINPADIAQMKFPELPENLISEPTLVWMLEAGRAEKHQIEASYLTSGMTWEANYVLLVDPGDTSADLNGWVTIKNDAGAQFVNAELKLVAGNINRAPRPSPLVDRMARAEAAQAGAQQFQEESFFEYHLYTLDRRTTLRNNESKQIALLSATAIPVEKQFIVGSNPYYYQGYNNPSGVVKEKVGVYLQLANSESSRLGMPLPAGTVRVYKADSKGSQQLIGEDSIEHTPKDERVRLRIGEAFDVTAERRQTDYRSLAKNVYEYAYEISIRNHKKEDITVRVLESIGGDWEILSSSFPAKKLSSSNVAFDVPVTHDGSATLAYRVRVKY